MQETLKSDFGCCQWIGCSVKRQLVDEECNDNVTSITPRTAVAGLLVQMTELTKGEKVAYVWQIVQVEGNGVHSRTAKVVKT